MATERKKFFEVDVPIMGTVVRLYGKSLKEFDKKIIKVDLTRNLRGKSMEASMLVKIEGDKAVAEPKRMLLLSSFIRRMMRDAISYVEDSFQAECLDGILRVKTFLITRKKVARSVRKALRDAARKYLIEDLKEKTREEIIFDMINNKIQRPLSLKLKKIYPLSLCEIRDLKIEKVIEGRARKPKEEKKEEVLDQVAELQTKEIDQAADLQVEGIDQMKEVEEALAKRAEKLKEQIVEIKPEGEAKESSEAEKPKKRGRKKKEESEKKSENKAE